MMKNKNTGVRNLADWRGSHKGVSKYSTKQAVVARFDRASNHPTKQTKVVHLGVYRSAAARLGLYSPVILAISVMSPMGISKYSNWNVNLGYW